VTRRPERPEALRGKYFLARQVVEAGLVTRKQLRSRAWRRLFQGVYVDAEVPVTHGLRCAAAVAHLLPSGAVIAGRSAAAVHGVGLADEWDAVEALVRRHDYAVPHEGVRVHRGVIVPDEVCRVRRLAVTSPVRTCWDLARWLDVVEAVVLVDRMLNRRLVTPAQLTTYLRKRHTDDERNERGAGRFARVIALADGRAESPMESRLRVRLVLAGLPRPEVQYVIRDDQGRHVARVDMAWVEKKVAAEYDGAWHARQLDRDRRRLNAITLAKWDVVHATSERLRDDFDGLVAEIRKALSSW
jgi:very-short-patch-repair endonuclease